MKSVPLLYETLTPLKCSKHNSFIKNRFQVCHRPRMILTIKLLLQISTCFFFFFCQTRPSSSHSLPNSCTFSGRLDSCFSTKKNCSRWRALHSDVQQELWSCSNEGDFVFSLKVVSSLACRLNAPFFSVIGCSAELVLVVILLSESLHFEGGVLTLCSQRVSKCISKRRQMFW